MPSSACTKTEIASADLLQPHGHSLSSFFFFFNDTATTEIYTLSLHDALPILGLRRTRIDPTPPRVLACPRDAIRIRPNTELAKDAGILLEFRVGPNPNRDRKSTRLNSSHVRSSYAVFCLHKNRNCFCRSPPTSWTFS